MLEERHKLNTLYLQQVTFKIIIHLDTETEFTFQFKAIHHLAKNDCRMEKMYAENIYLQPFA